VRGLHQPPAVAGGDEHPRIVLLGVAAADEDQRATAALALEGEQRRRLRQGFGGKARIALREPGRRRQSDPHHKRQDPPHRGNHGQSTAARMWSGYERHPISKGVQSKSKSAILSPVFRRSRAMRLLKTLAAIMLLLLVSCKRERTMEEVAGVAAP